MQHALLLSARAIVASRYCPDIASFAEILASLLLPGALHDWVPAPSTPPALVEHVEHVRRVDLYNRLVFAHWVHILSQPGGLEGWTVVSLAQPDTPSDLERGVHRSHTACLRVRFLYTPYYGVRCKVLSRLRQGSQD